MMEILGPEQSVPAGSSTTVHVQYTNEESGLRPGAFIRIGFDTKAGAGFSGEEPTAQVVIKGPAEVAHFPNRWFRSITHFPGTGMSDLFIISLRITGKGLKKGDKLDIYFNNFFPGNSSLACLEFFYHIDTDNRFPLSSIHPNAPRYLQYITPDGSSFPQWQKCRGNITISPLAPVRADLSLPSYSLLDRCIDMRLVAYDRYWNPVPEIKGDIRPVRTRYSDCIELSANNFTVNKEGFCKIPLKFSKEGIVSNILYNVSDIGITSANPVKVTKSPPPLTLLWGELHGHTNLSDGGSRTPEDFFRYAREVRGLDFASLADHTFGLAVKGHWEKLEKVVSDFYRPPAFTSILGYEIIGDPGTGHRNIYFPGETGKLIMSDAQPGGGGSFPGEDYPAYSQVWNRDIPKVDLLSRYIDMMKDTEHIYTGHHFAPEFKIFEKEKDILRLYEACSEWGISEEGYRHNRSTTTLEEIFARGISPGLTGGSDDHFGRAGYMGWAPEKTPIRYPSGITGVFSPENNRESLYGALKNKLCFATTGARVIMEPDVRRNNKNLSVSVNITGTDFVDRVWVMKNGREVFQSYCGSAEEFSFNWSDSDFKETDNCYIRFAQIDGQIAWINPLPFWSPHK